MCCVIPSNLLGESTEAGPLASLGLSIFELTDGRPVVNGLQGAFGTITLVDQSHLNGRPCRHIAGKKSGARDTETGGIR